MPTNPDTAAEVRVTEKALAAVEHFTANATFRLRMAEARICLRNYADLIERVDGLIDQRIAKYLRTGVSEIVDVSQPTDAGEKRTCPDQ